MAQQICSNTSGSRGNGYLLELFRTFERYAWGPACLANLYRTLGRATRLKDGIRTLTGPLQLLQVIIILYDQMIFMYYYVYLLSIHNGFTCGADLGLFSDEDRATDRAELGSDRVRFPFMSDVA